MGLTYRESGVDIDKGDRFVDIVKRKLRKEEQRNIGLFGGLYDLTLLDVRNPVLVASTDGVGTKLLLAKEAKKYSTVGIDLVAMCVNDIITTGAKPLFFLDYMATCDLEIKTAAEVMEGIIEGCRRSECSLLGGETAEMPGIYRKGEYELAGFAVGVVEKERIIDCSSVKSGDVIVGIGSSGIHSNGLSLARKALFEKRGYSYNDAPSPLGHPLIDELLIPTRIYVRIVRDVLNSIPVKGISHITGGGLYSNVARTLPSGTVANIFWEAIRPHHIFTIIQQAGSIDEEEMRKTFNMGIGLVFIIDRKEEGNLVSVLRERNEHPLIVGKIVKN